MEAALSNNFILTYIYVGGVNVARNLLIVGFLRARGNRSFLLCSVPFKNVVTRQ